MIHHLLKKYYSKVENCNFKSNVSQTPNSWSQFSFTLGCLSPYGYLIYPQMGRCSPAPQTLTLFTTKMVRSLIPSFIRQSDKINTLFTTKIPENRTLMGRTSLELLPYKGVPPRDVTKQFYCKYSLK